MANDILAGLRWTQPVYAVLDGARDKRVRSWALDTRAPCWPLFAGNLPAALDEVSPRLLRLVPGHPYVDQFFDLGWRRDWGILLTTAAPSRELRRHLRRFLAARLEDGTRVTFRFYDPRVLRLFLPACSRDEEADFFGPIDAMAAPGPGGETRTFSRPGPAVRSHTGGLRPLVIRGPVLRAFEEEAQRQFEALAVSTLRKSWPQLWQAGPEAAEARVKAACARAKAWGLSRKSDVLRFANVDLALGPSFEEDPKHRWAAAVLRDPENTPTGRVDVLCREARERLELYS